VRTPTDNAQAESRIKYVKRNFFQARKFRDINDCNRQLREWMESVSHQRIQSMTKRRLRELFEEEEKAKLQPLPNKGYELSQWSRRCYAKSELTHFAKSELSQLNLDNS